MSLRRLVIPRSSLQGDEARLAGSLSHYLGRVLRLERGAAVSLVDGSGWSYAARIDRITRDEVVLRIERREPPPAGRQGRLVLVYGVSRRVRTEWVLQKTTELGVDWVLPALCERSVSRPTHPERTLERWVEIISQATRQCGRATVPLLSPPAPLEAALAELDGAEVRLIATSGGTPLGEQAALLGRATGDIALAVGPEGGFTDGEVALARGAGFTTVGLGGRTLRTETAAVAFVALAAYLGGRL